MENLRLEHVYTIVLGLFVFLGLVYLAFWLSLKWPEIVKLFSAVKARYVIDYDELADQEPESVFAPVPPDTYQVEPSGTTPINTSMVPSDTAALARHLAELKQPNGLHWLSANKIVAAVPGNRNEVLAIVREVRGESDVAASDPRFPESTKNGRPVASHLRTQARRS